MSNSSKSYIPSMTDLLSSPKLKGMTNRLNSVSIFSTARSVLDEVAAEAKNAASSRRMPDIYELSERIAARLKTVQVSQSGNLINATGVLLPPEIAVSEIPLKALDQMVASFGDESSASSPDILQPTSMSSNDDTETKSSLQETTSVRTMICNLTGASDAIVVNGHAAALLLTFGTFAARDRQKRRHVLATPGDLYETLSGCRIADLLSHVGCETTMVGSLMRATLDDYADGASDETAMVYRADGIDGCLALDRILPELSQLVDFARKRNLPLVYDTEWGTFHPTAEYGLNDVPTCRDLLKQGVSLLVMSCGRLNGCDFASARDDAETWFAGQTRCCAPVVIMGEKSLIREIRKSPLYSSFVPSRHDMAALAGVLSLSMSQEMAENELPVWQLLSTDNENLKLRADRMALQIAAIDGVTDARVVSAPVCLTPLRPRYTLPSQEIRVTFESKTAIEVLAALAQPATSNTQPNETRAQSKSGRLGIAAIVVPDQPNTIALNLRTVFAKYDMLIVEALAML